MEEMMDSGTTNYKVALLAGGAAGTSVDVILFPLDTIKTRLQSEAGFRAAGGLKGIYSGLLSAALGSAPSAAMFFLAYETSKKNLKLLSGRNDRFLDAANHMASASIGEVAACLIRVPVEVVKQRTQTLTASSSFKTFRTVVGAEGLRGFYRGYLTTVLREIPFSMIQFPLWEFLKFRWAEHQGVASVTAWQASVCGAIAGGTSAAITTPLDVAKTRVMLAERGSLEAQGNMVAVLRQVALDKGVKGLFAGLVPRVLWISVGGAIFLGVYDRVRISSSRFL
ncbi:S-adenosylmethionine mitochondrial carrier protein [Plakobranchus ocellatus]|uniref:S-adenosylmethionine mitochondrial carrier protein n=1 Tax=Plakobranchus ocellatus TaxID=259542 RepID=A0AAV4ATM9_9GAST|nr:S-adenosylmethionine mitochondrial carrier protein [Plakobranchus ocellatus]